MRKIIYVSLLSLSLTSTLIVTAQTRSTRNHPSPDQSFEVRLAEKSQQRGLEEQIANLSQQITNGLAENQKRTIAVVEFVDLKGNITNFGRFLAEELITRLYQTKKFKVIERQLLNKVIAEQKLSLTGVIEQASAQRLGRLLGVDSIASGTVTDLGKSLRINARLINAETGEIFAVASTEIVKDESVMNLLGSDAVLPTPDSNPQSSRPSSNKEAPKKVSANDFTFDLSLCKRSGQSVTCKFTITNDSSEDKRFQLFQEYASFASAGSEGERSSRIFDNLGNEYRASGSRLGSEVGSSNQLQLELVLVPHIVTMAELRFENFSSEATTIKLLRVTFAAITSSDLSAIPRPLYADFRDVPIAK